jgi:ABC-type glycerol-3-phosphate transport system substrate-binding protein
MSEKKMPRRSYVKYAGAGIVVVAAAGAGAYYATRPKPTPTTTPTTVAPTTVAPTTVAPTTVAPTTRPTPSPGAPWWEQYMPRLDRVFGPTGKDYILKWLRIRGDEYLIENDFARTKVDWDEAKKVCEGKTIGWHMESTDINGPELFKGLFEKFMGCKINLEATPPDTLHEALMAEFVAKTGRNQGAELFGAWAYAYFPYCADINPYLQKIGFDVNQYHPAFRMSFTQYYGPRKGAVLGIPFDADENILTYRRNLLEKAGHDKPPATMEETLQYCEELDEVSKKEGRAWYPWIVEYASRGFMIYWYWHNVAVQWEDIGDRGLLKPGTWEPDFIGSNGGGIEALKTLKKLFEYSPPGNIDFGYGDFEETWLRGKAAMAITPQCIPMKSYDTARSSFSPLQHEGEEVRADVIPRATVKHSRGPGIEHVTVYGLVQAAKNLDAATYWMLYSLSQEATLIVTLALTGNESGYKDVVCNPKVWAIHNSYWAVAQELNYAVTTPFQFCPEGAEIDQAIGVEIYRYCSGEVKDPEVALKNAENAARAILERAGYFGPNAPPPPFWRVEDWCREFNVPLPEIPTTKVEPPVR